MTRRHSPPLNGVLAKSASGALELVPVALVPNLSRALDELKAAGFAIVGLDGTADACIEDTRLVAPDRAGDGRRGQGPARTERPRPAITLPASRPMGAIASLNVSNAAAVALQPPLGTYRRKP